MVYCVVCGCCACTVDAVSDAAIVLTLIASTVSCAGSGMFPSSCPCYIVSAARVLAVQARQSTGAASCPCLQPWHSRLQAASVVRACTRPPQQPLAASMALHARDPQLAASKRAPGFAQPHCLISGRSCWPACHRPHTMPIQLVRAASVSNSSSRDRVLRASYGCRPSTELVQCTRTCGHA